MDHSVHSALVLTHAVRVHNFQVNGEGQILGHLGLKTVNQMGFKSGMNVRLTHRGTTGKQT